MDRPDFAFALVEAAPDGILTVDAQGMIVFVNAAMTSLFGYTRDELIGQTIEVLVPDAQRGAHVAERAAYLASPRVREMGAALELRGRRKDGTVFPVEIMLSPLEGRTGVRAVAVVRDVSRRRVAEEEARLWKRVVDVSMIGIALIEPGSNVVGACNPAFARMHGCTMDEMIGKPALELVPEQERARAIAWYRGGAEPHTVYRALRLRKDGTIFPCQGDATRLPDPAGRCDGAIMHVQDITDVVRGESERERLQREAQVSLAAREELVAIASHDIRSPLGGIKLQLMNVARGLRKLEATDAARLAERVEQIHEGLEHVFGLLDSLLERHRREAGALEFHRDDVDLTGLMQRIAQRMRPQFAQVESALALEAQAGVTGVWDRLRLEQAITNILANALRYSAGAAVDVRLTADDDDARIAIRDRGPGIDPRVLPLLFERGSSDGQGGFGLGLWIARRIVDAHGGQIEVDTDGDGTTFTIVLPRKN